MADDFAWRRLAQLTDDFGHRFSGSENYNRAVDWVLAAMRADGLDAVRADPVMVPRWVRGNESADITHPGHHALAMIGLGGTVATPPSGLEADVLATGHYARVGYDEDRRQYVLRRGVDRRRDQ